jgi:K+-transporting ATPase ATPase C chain
MTAHLRANLWLLLLTVVICSILYPAVLWGIGQTVFRDKAQGSLIDKEGQAVGSRLIAQPFSGDEYFQPRPSAASYNGAASAASNWGANNPALRKRVLAQLGPILKYGPQGPRPGQLIGTDIEAWFQKDRFEGKPGLVAQWANRSSDLAQAWVKAGEMNGKYVEDWMKEHPSEVERWVKENPKTPEPKPEDLAVPFFEWYSKSHPGTFPVIEAEEKDDPEKPGEKVKLPKLTAAKEGKDIQSNFYPMWREEHPAADLAPVPADMVMASGSGLDPHITLQNALYQLDRVAGKWADATRGDPAKVRKDIEDLLRQKAEAPLGGLVGVNLVNVLEVNLALRERYGTQAGASR